MMPLVPLDQGKRRSYDRNGFEREEKETQAINYLIDEQLEMARFKRWEELLPLIPKLRNKGHEGERKLIMEVRNGVHDSLRYRVWPLLILEPLRRFEDCRGVLENKDINLDLQRTFPTYREAKWLEVKMKVVLNALAVAIPEVGYCQGMNFIVGTLLLRLSQEEAFNVAYHIFHWQKHDKLLMSLDLIHEQLYALEKLIRKHYPKLHKQMQIHEVEAIIYASSWFITLFCGCLPACYTLRILECFLLEGEKVLYRVALQIIKVKKHQLKRLKSLEGMIKQLKNYEEFNETNLDRFFAQMYSLSLTRQEIAAYKSQYHQEQSVRI